MIVSFPSENEATAGNSGDEESELNLNSWEELESEEEPRRPKKPKLALQALSDKFEEDRPGLLPVSFLRRGTDCRRGDCRQERQGGERLLLSGSPLDGIRSSRRKALPTARTTQLQR